jgi:enterochelin esterase-like enzyme
VSRRSACRNNVRFRAACERAVMRVEWVELPGGHTWAVWGPGLAIGLDRIAGRLGWERK